MAEIKILKVLCRLSGEISDMFFNYPAAEEAYDAWCHAPEGLGPDAKIYLMGAAQKFLSDCRYAKFRLDVTSGQLADDFLARV